MGETETTNAGKAAAPAPKNVGMTALSVVLGILLPGLGHLSRGLVFKGILFIVILQGLFVAGMVETSGYNFTLAAQERHPVMFHLQRCMGGPAFIAQGQAPNDMTLDATAFDEPKRFEIGMLMAAIAGLLNLLLLVDLIFWTPGSSGGAHEASDEGEDTRES